MAIMRSADHQSMPAIIWMTMAMVIMTVVAIAYCFVGPRAQENRRVASLYRSEATSDSRSHEAFFREVHNDQGQIVDPSETQSNERAPGQPLSLEESSSVPSILQNEIGR